MKEIWKDIPNYEGYYQASNTGRIKSIDRVVKAKGNGLVLKKGKVLSQQTSNDGYFQISLCCKSVKKYFRVHRLIALTFIDNPKGLPVVNHKNRKTKDNAVENLEWCTIQYNCTYMDAHLKGSEKRSHKIGQYSKDGELLNKFKSISITSNYGFNPGKVSMVCNGQRKHHKGFIFKRIDRL